MPRNEKLRVRKRLRRLYEETNFGLLIQMSLTAVQLYIFIIRNYLPKDGKYSIFTNIFYYLMLSSMDYCRSDTNKFRYIFSTAFIIIVINSQLVFSWLKYCVSVCQSSLRETLRQLQIKTLEQYSNSQPFMQVDTQMSLKWNIWYPVFCQSHSTLSCHHLITVYLIIAFKVFCALLGVLCNQ